MKLVQRPIRRTRIASAVWEIPQVPAQLATREQRPIHRTTKCRMGGRGGRPVVRGWTELRTEPRTEPRTGQSPNPPELRPRTTAPYDGVSPPYDGPNHGRTVGRRIVVSATDQGPPIHGSARHISPPYVLCEARMRDCPALHHTSLKRSLYQTLAFGHRMRLSR